MVMTLGIFSQAALADVNGCYIYLPLGCPMQPRSVYNVKGYFALDSYAGTAQCKRRAHDYLEWCGLQGNGGSTTTYYNKSSVWTSAFVAFRSNGAPYTNIYVRAGGTEIDELVGQVAGRP